MFTHYELLKMLQDCDDDQSVARQLIGNPGYFDNHRHLLDKVARAYIETSTDQTLKNFAIDYLNKMSSSDIVRGWLYSHMPMLIGAHVLVIGLVYIFGTLG